MRSKAQQEFQGVAGAQSGFVVVFFALIFSVVLICAALTFDLGLSLVTERKLHYATDAAALAGVGILPTSDQNISTEVQALVQGNGFGAADVTAVQCGRWRDPLSPQATPTAQNSGQFVFTACANGNGAPCSACTDAQANAVRVTGRRGVGAIFANVVGLSSFSPHVESIAYRSGAGSGCMRPFGIELPSLNNIGISYTFTVGKNAPGNWGKLDIGGNMSSGRNFEEAMLNGVCDEEVALNSNVTTGTGFGGSIANVFSEFDQSQHISKRYDMIIGVTTGFPNGNGGVTLLEFIKVDFVSQTGSGGNWRGTFRLKERNVVPGGGGAAGVRYLIK